MDRLGGGVPLADSEDLKEGSQGDCFRWELHLQLFAPEQ